jgi:hypothetical protein
MIRLSRANRAAAAGGNGRREKVKKSLAQRGFIFNWLRFWEQ